ncbi:serine/threonine-protein kinase Nek8-like [Ischnura elegans]|uniref:serine/threonine-protein kinase Nek8-like n=1 Tax=Ischnura elegans TaxID=197161 RepID=UPI001ED89E87|nr:serine/threonine-protein kinase Nek8-like [Ischnura elegans]
MEETTATVYEEVRHIARGSQGVVALYRRKKDGQEVVQKRISISMLTNDEKRVTSNEVKVLSMLDHPNVIKYYDSFFEDSAIVIVMEYALGGSLHNYLRIRNGNLLPEKDCLCLFSQIVVGIQHIHSLNILHRDLKPQNIFLSADKTIAKIGDFGISKVLNSQSHAESLVGTPNYLSPELCEGKPYGKKSDIWALGCILYELLSLRKAFDGPCLGAIINKISQGTVTMEVESQPSELTCNLLQCLLRKRPSLRPCANMLLAHPALISILPRLLTLGSGFPPPNLMQ